MTRPTHDPADRRSRTARGGGPALPPGIEEAIAEALDAAALELTDGRDEVERELRAHFEDGLEAGLSPEQLLRRFGDPLATGRRIARTRPKAAARARGEGRWWMKMSEMHTEIVRVLAAA